MSTQNNSHNQNGKNSHGALECIPQKPFEDIEKVKNSTSKATNQPVYIYNSLTKKKELFEPYNPPFVGMYSCGPTVYGHTHLGHIKKYVNDDILKRTLTFNGYIVKHVQNVTDVGHLVSDGDEGEDKLEKGARQQGLDVYKLARKYEKEFYDAMRDVNVIKPDVIQRAADDKSVKQQIEFITELIDKGYAYVADKAVYFDVSKLPNYNPFSNQSLEDKLKGSREEVIVDSDKRNPADFALWVFRKGIHKNHIMHWDSPWGDGFPGWHIECSAISMCNLGEQIDIHTGGEDLLEVHHPNEIAQNYGVVGHQVVKYWVHSRFLLTDGVKMSKSLGNFYTFKDTKDRGFDPIALRYYILGTHYRKPMNFTWQGLESAQNALYRLRRERPKITDEHTFDDDEREQIKNNKYYLEFLKAINDDFNTPKALAVVWKLIEDKQVLDKEKILLLSEFDEVLGIDIFAEGDYEEVREEIPLEDLPQEVRDKIELRQKARENKNYEEADSIRNEIRELGYEIEDTPDGVVVRKG